MATTSKTDDPLIVVVSGGGPVGLTFSLHLVMMMGEKVKIMIYEGRWFVDKHGKTCWQGEAEGKTRRDQVVTLQDHVIKEMPKYVQQGLFEQINERVWPTSRNIPIREVEDRLFHLIQPFVQNGQIELIPENLDEQCERLIKGHFDILVGADGSTSFVRRYCNIQMVSEGVEYACGVAYNIPNHVDPTDEPLHQALNCMLTISQTRYLVNSSTSRRGYLNIRLIQDEYDELRKYLENFLKSKEPLDLMNFDQVPQTPVWSIIRQGLLYFKIPAKYVFRVIPIEINVRHASLVVRELRYEIDASELSPDTSHKKQYKTALAFLAGDAAMNVHFWPGRGMNSGMKGAMALARNIFRSCTKDDSIQIRRPLRFLDFLKYEGFMAILRAREQQGRSLRILVNPIDKDIESSYSYAFLSHCHKRYSTKLVAKLKESRDRLQKIPDWPHKSRSITDLELQSASNRISPDSVAQLSLANPWPTREMSGAEVLVEETFPYDLKRFLAVPGPSLVQLHRSPTLIIRYRFVNLWIVGERNNETTNNLIDEIRNSHNFLQTTANVDQVYQLHVVQTIEKATEWIRSHKDLIRKADVRFKVITFWIIKANQTAVDVIRAVRSESPRTSILIFTNKVEETQPALEFPNVMATDQEFELKEFVGVNQETQWNAGLLVTSFFAQPPIPTPGRPKIDVPETLPARSLLIWIDSKSSDPKTAQEIAKKHSTLEIIFLPTYQEAEISLNQCMRDFCERKKVVTICRGFYQSESKSYLDIFRLFKAHLNNTNHFVVYTRNREELLKRTPNIPDGPKILTKRAEILNFIDEHLN